MCILEMYDKGYMSGVTQNKIYMVQHRSEFSRYNISLIKWVEDRVIVLAGWDVQWAFQTETN